MDTISVMELSKGYPSRDGFVHALRQISFTVKEGEFVAVVGPSGCGKSTLLKILAGLLPPPKERRAFEVLPSVDNAAISAWFFRLQFSCRGEGSWKTFSCP